MRYSVRVKKSTNSIIGILIAIVVAIAVFATTGNSPTSLGTTSVGSETTNPNTSGTTSGTTTGTKTGTTGGTTPKTYSMAEIAMHNSRASCWSAVNGSVYDLTRWISAHPGGSQAILYMCGIDGTEAFTAQHGGQSRPESELAKLKIGTLK